jgi:hypothetical protein
MQNLKWIHTRMRKHTQTLTHTYKHTDTHTIYRYILPSLIIDLLYIYSIYINISILLSVNPLFIHLCHGLFVQMSVLMKLTFSKHSNINTPKLQTAKERKEGHGSSYYRWLHNYITRSVRFTQFSNFPSYKTAHCHNSQDFTMREF